MPKTKRGDAFRAGASVVALAPATGKSSAAAAKRGQALSSVVYLGHVPHGFYEEQMQGFFSQFGAVKKLRLARSKKTTRSKGYAYIMFEDPKVAIVVANTMDKYMLFDKTLKCSVLTNSAVHANLFKGAGKQFKKVPWRDIARDRQNAPRDEEQVAKVRKRLAAKDKKKRARLAALGIEYDFEGYAGAGAAEPLEDAAAADASGGDSSSEDDGAAGEAGGSKALVVAVPKGNNKGKRGAGAKKRKSPLAREKVGEEAAEEQQEEQGGEDAAAAEEEEEDVAPTKRARATRSGKAAKAKATPSKGKAAAAAAASTKKKAAAKATPAKGKGKAAAAAQSAAKAKAKASAKKKTPARAATTKRATRASTRKAK